jgi:peptide chain release factor 1
MWPSLVKKKERFDELERLLGQPEIVTDPARYGPLAREHGSLSKLIKPYLEFLEVSSSVEQAGAMLATETDPEMRSYAEQELTDLRSRFEALKNKIEEQLLVDPSEDYPSIIMEIRAGTGGDEAALFAGDLYEMYTRYAREQGWNVETIEFSEGEMGGFKEIVMSIGGDSVFQQLRYESGGHRVQRVPKTETQGRIHTSAATVAILPEPDQVQIEIKDSDIEWEKMRAGGAGGQHVNKTESAVRIWYKKGTPDEIEVKCQDGRSQHKNYDTAMRILRSRVFERHQQKIHKERAEARRTLIGSGDRSERIRTYNFPQNRLTDHRINLTLHKLDAIIAGALGEVIKPLQEFDRRQRLGEAS